MVPSLGIGDVLTTHLNSLVFKSVTLSLWFLHAAESIDPQQTYLHKSFKRNTSIGQLNSDILH